MDAVFSLLDSIPISEIENNTTNDIKAAAVIQSEETARIQRKTCCFPIYATVAGIQIADARRKMRLRIDRMLFSSEVTKLRKDAQNLQPEKKASKTWSCQTTLLDRK